MFACFANTYVKVYVQGEKGGNDVGRNQKNLL